jgi:hypothetical protein
MMTLTLGCAEGPPPELPLPESLAELGEQFEPDAAGSVEGRVRWSGPVPTVPAMLSPHSPSLPPPHPEGFQEWPNPHTPQVDPSSSGVGDVVVYLRGIDPRRSRPWDHEPARVEQNAIRMCVKQDGVESRVGFVRRGTDVALTAADAHLYRLQARGAAFFTVAFAPEHLAHERTLTESGLVELIGGAGRFWMRSYLFVDDHPYYTRTDTRGAFTLRDVPEGEYDLVVWMPNWRVADVDTDPSWSLGTRARFHPPPELTRRVRVRRGTTESVTFETSAEAFGR